jgi:hypothetical protein
MKHTMSLLLAAIVTFTVGCGPNLEVLSNQQNAQLVVGLVAGTVMLRVHPLNASTPETCPDLSGATATQDGVVMTPSAGGWTIPVPAPFPNGGCSEFSWIAPFDAAHDPSVPVTFTLRQGHQTWQLVVAHFAAPHPIAVPEAPGFRGMRLSFSRQPVAQLGRPSSTWVGFRATGTESTGDPWEREASESGGRLEVSIPFTSASGAGTMEFSTHVNAEVTSCTGPASCLATYETVQQAAFTIW